MLCSAQFCCALVVQFSFYDGLISFSTFDNLKEEYDNAPEHSW